MKITICSAFRSSAHRLTPYFVQVDSLRKRLAKWGDTLSLVLGEGDHTDDTRDKLPGWVSSMGLDAQIVQVDHGGPEFGPVVDEQRFKQLAFVWNGIWRCIPEDSDVAIFLESDLIWHPDALTSLAHLVIQGYHAVAPMVLEQGSDRWYDTWAFRVNGEQFSKEPPYYPGWRPGGMVRMDSAGSCLAIKGSLARQLTWPEENVVIGLCRQVYRINGPVWLNASVSIYHA